MTNPDPSAGPTAAGPDGNACRVEHLDVNGQDTPIVIHGAAGAEFTDVDRGYLADIVAAAQRRARQRTTLIPLPTRHTITRALRDHLPNEQDRRAAARAVHQALREDSWVEVDPSFQVGDTVPVRWLDGAGYHYGEGTVEFVDGEPYRLAVRLHPAGKRMGLGPRSETPAAEHGDAS